VSTASRRARKESRVTRDASCPGFVTAHRNEVGVTFALEILMAAYKLALMSHILGEDTEIVLDAKLCSKTPAL
jgi:hypothetical protein